MLPEPPQPQKPSADLKRIHTYQSDVEELMQKQNVSKATIAIAESERRTETGTPTGAGGAGTPTESKVFKISTDIPAADVTRWNVRLILLYALAVLSLAGIGTGISFFAAREPTLPVTEQPVTTNAGAIALEGTESRAGTIGAIQKTLAEISVPQNELRVVPITAGASAVGTPKLFLLIGAHASPELTRALGSIPILGLHGFKGGRPFLLFSVLSYDYAFAEMLDWEEDMLADIGPLFGFSPRELLADAGETTEEAVENTIAFKDVIIRNKDARAAFTPEGDIIFLYSFLDRQTLVLTTNEDTLRALIQKAGSGRLR